MSLETEEEREQVLRLIKAKRHLTTRQLVDAISLENGAPVQEARVAMICKDLADSGKLRFLPEAYTCTGLPTKGGKHARAI